MMNTPCGRSGRVPVPEAASAWLEGSAPDQEMLMGLRCPSIPKQKHPAPAPGSRCCWDLAWLLRVHCTQGKLGFLSGLKINSLGTLGKKEVVSVTALPKHLSVYWLLVAFARFLVLKISH